jgi:ABC-type Fe3+ transport system substrate-binding protein
MSKGRNRWVRLVAVLGVLALIATACGDDDDSGGGFEPLTREELVEKAEEEGQVLVYSEATEAKNDLMFNAFRAKYPNIDAQYVRLTPPDMIARFSAEDEAGANVADAIQGTSVDWHKELLAAGKLTALTPELVPSLGTYPADYLRPDSGSATNSITAWGICINTDIISEADAPKEFADLADPKYAGEILLADPNLAGVYMAFWDIMVRELGEDTVRGIAANVKQVYASGVPATQAVGAGEGGIEIVCVPTLATLVSGEGAPVEYIQPELTNIFEHRPNLVTDAPHPYAARLWIDFALSEEGVNEWVQLDLSPYKADEIPATAILSEPDWADRVDTLNDILGTTPEG